MPKQVLISTQVFPPMSSGSAMILYELLKHLPQDDLVAVHGISDPPLMNGTELGMDRHMVLVFGSYLWTVRCNRRCPWIYLPLVRQRLKRFAKEHAVKRIYAHFPSSVFLVAAYQAAEDLGLPLTVYFDILWQELPECDMRLARKYERRILQRADSRFAITEFAADFLCKEHGLPVEFLPHTIDLANKAEGFQALPEDAQPTIHFCGGIYPVMNQDAVVRLTDAAQRAKCRPQLDLCAPGLPLELQGRGLQARYLPRGELRAAQRQSTMQFLPLAFNSGRPLTIRHNFPTKAMEYLCSGRPILVHAPADCYLTWLARKEGFALVVDRPDTDELAAAIDRLVADRELQEELVAKALAFVNTRDSRQWANVLWKALCGGN
jgi:glycosyltransferase involved in cell wall biosynthesis